MLEDRLARPLQRATLYLTVVTYIRIVCSRSYLCHIICHFRILLYYFLFLLPTHSKFVTVYPHLGTQMLTKNAVHIRTLSTNPQSVFSSSTPLLFLIRNEREHLWQHVNVFSDACYSKFRKDQYQHERDSQALMSAQLFCK